MYNIAVYHAGIILGAWTNTDAWVSPTENLSWEKEEFDNLGPTWGKIYSSNDKNSERLF